MKLSLIALLILGIFFLLLSAIFLLAALSPFSVEILAEAIALLAIALILLFLYYRGMALEARRPMEVRRQIMINTSDDLSGKSELRDLKCRHCGATLSANDVSITDAGVIVKCPYCGAVYRLEEEPKW